MFVDLEDIKESCFTYFLDMPFFDMLKPFE